MYRIQYELRFLAESTYGAVAESDSACELNKVRGRDGVLGHEGDKVVDRVVDTVVGRKKRLNGREQEHRAVCSTTAVDNG